MAETPETEQDQPGPVAVGEGPAPLRLGESTPIDYWYDLSQKPDGTRCATTYAYGMPIDTQTVAPVDGDPVPWDEVLAPSLAKIRDDADTYGIAP
jgi:hypothetical protein